jgi:hypothetical protein
MVIDVPVTETNDNRLRFKLAIDAEIMPANLARRQANKWLLKNAGNLLHADSPELQWTPESIVWQFDVLLGYPNQGIVGSVGKISVNAESGECQTPPNFIQQLNANAKVLTTH